MLQIYSPRVLWSFVLQICNPKLWVRTLMPKLPVFNIKVYLSKSCVLFHFAFIIRNVETSTAYRLHKNWLGGITFLTFYVLLWALPVFNDNFYSNHFLSKQLISSEICPWNCCSWCSSGDLNGNSLLLRCRITRFRLLLFYLHRKYLENTRLVYLWTRKGVAISVSVFLWKP